MTYLDPNMQGTYVIVDMVKDNLINESYYNLISSLKPEFSKDGNQFCYLYGNDLQSGIAGFGSTVYEAMVNFWLAFHKDKA